MKLDENEKTQEEMLVDELVGTGLQIKGKVKKDVSKNKQREVKMAVKRVWMNNASCEVIEATYYKCVNKALNSREDSNSKSSMNNSINKQYSTDNNNYKQQIENNTFKNNEMNKESSDFNINNIKKTVTGWWKNKNIREKIKNHEHHLNNIFNRENNEIKTKKDQYPEKKSDFQSFEKEHYKDEKVQITEEEKLVDKLVGTGHVFGDDLKSIDILTSYKFGIKVAVQLVWANGGSCEEIQEAYDKLVIPYLNEKKKQEEQMRIKRESAELKRELTRKRIKREFKNRKFIFEGYIKEIKEGFSDSTKEFQCTVILEKNLIVIEKKDTSRDNLLGEKKILFSDILTVDYEKSKILSIDYIQIHTQGFIFKIINKKKDNKLKHFYNKFIERIHNEKLVSIENYDNIKSSSSADELVKWYNLKERGIITNNEFEKKKRELL